MQGVYITFTLYRVCTLPRHGNWTLTVYSPCQGKVLDPPQGPVKIELVHDQHAVHLGKVWSLCKVCQQDPVEVWSLCKACQ